MKRHIEQEDWTAIDALLRYVPRYILIGFLPEKDWKKYNGNQRKTEVEVAENEAG